MPHTFLKLFLKELEGNAFEKVLLVHQNPDWVEADYKEMIQKVIGTNIELTDDGRVYSF